MNSPVKSAAPAAATARPGHTDTPLSAADLEAGSNMPTGNATNDALAKPAAERVRAIDQGRLAADLDTHGCAVIEHLLPPAECVALVKLYPIDARFRSRVVMEQHGYGRGEYKYFNYPLPPVVAALRAAFYAELAPIANHWNAAMGFDACYPATLTDFIARCYAAGQRRPTPLLLRYGTGDYNRLHQDLYGQHVFPLQITVLLSATGQDFTGGEFVITEQRPRMQSRPEVVPLEQGDAVIFAVNQRPVHGKRGIHRVKLRHGVSRVRSGQRHAAGIIFHDAA